MTNEVKNLMEKLDITEQQALELIEEDKKIDKMKSAKEINSDLTTEQLSASKKARQADHKKQTVYKFDTSKRKRPANVGKRNLIDAIEKTLSELGASDVDITNPEREINFKVDNVKYKVVLSAPRK